MKRVVVLTGAGMSAESGLSTFRDHGGLWDGHEITDVASPEGWERDPELVLDFYNVRREKAMQARPNAGHLALATLEVHYSVKIITQNVDDLHERGGSTDVLHLHGSLFEKRSSTDPFHIVEEYGEIRMGDLCPDGSQYRPNVVWFGEPVPMIQPAASICSTADLFIVVGTSLVVYPAAGLINYVPHHAKKFLIDPKIPETGFVPDLQTIEATATSGVTELVEKLILQADS